MFGVVGLIGQLSALAGALAFSREHEREADRIGTQLLQRSGYQADEAAKVWLNLLAELRAVPENDPSHNSVLFATHPGIEERSRTLQELAAGQAPGQTREAEFRAQLAPLRQGLLEDELRRGRLPESLALLNRMTAREPGSAELLHFRGEVRRLQGGEADLGAALADFEAALAAPQPLALTHRSLGYLYRSLKQPQAARSAWTEYLARAPQAGDAALIQQSISEL